MGYNGPEVDVILRMDSP